jgi:hypothetical protein
MRRVPSGLTVPGNSFQDRVAEAFEEGAGEANGFEKFFAGLFSAIGASPEQVFCSYKTVKARFRQSRPEHVRQSRTCKTVKTVKARFWL